MRIALESGPIPDEALRHYRPADEGDAALLALGPDRILVQLAQARASERPMDRMFAFSHETTSRGADVTFAGRREVLIQQLPELERLWSAWPAFAGVALHGFEP